MTKKAFTLAVALTFAVLAAAAPTAYAKNGADDPLEPPECQVEDGGVIVCQ